MVRYWIPIILIGIGGAYIRPGRQTYSQPSEICFKKAIATITGIGGMAGGVGSFFIQKGSGGAFRL